MSGAAAARRSTASRFAMSAGIAGFTEADRAAVDTLSGRRANVPLAPALERAAGGGNGIAR